MVSDNLQNLMDQEDITRMDKLEIRLGGWDIINPNNDDETAYAVFKNKQTKEFSVSLINPRKAPFVFRT